MIFICDDGNMMNSFTQIKTKWNNQDICAKKKIFLKEEIHLCRHFKRWSSNRKAENVAVSSGSRTILEALQHIPVTNETQNAIPTFLTVPFRTMLNNNSNLPNDAGQADRAVTAPGHLNARVNNQDRNPRDAIPRKPRKPRQCQVSIDGQRCPDPLTCSGRGDRSRCVLIRAGGNKRKYPASRQSATCQVCGLTSCHHGIRSRKHCPRYVG